MQNPWTVPPPGPESHVAGEAHFPPQSSAAKLHDIFACHRKPSWFAFWAAGFFFGFILWRSAIENRIELFHIIANPTWPQWKTLRTHPRWRYFVQKHVETFSSLNSEMTTWLNRGIKNMAPKKAWEVTCLKLWKSNLSGGFFVRWKKNRQSWVEVGKVYDWKKTFKVARRFQNVFPEPWILCPRLALDLGSGEAGNCVGALTIENRQKILSDLKTFYSYAWVVYFSIFSCGPLESWDMHRTHLFVPRHCEG